MPELPEVHTITTDLQKHVVGAKITKVQVFEETFRKVRAQVLPSAAVFTKKVENTKIVDVERVAKNIVFSLDSGDFVQVHLAMTGRLLFRKTGFDEDRWARVVFYLEKDGKSGELRYTDLRMFGKVTLMTSKELAELKKKYGPDPIKEDFDHYEFLKQVQGKRTNIKNAILDQAIISGVGNIYANDALWMAQIHPEAKTSDFTPPMAKTLLASIREILTESIDNRGSTLEDKMYVDIFGKSGNQQNYFRVYGHRECRRCGEKVKFTKLNERGTYYCEVCQIKTDQKIEASERKRGSRHALR